jgi:hypothetical protein
VSEGAWYNDVKGKPSLQRVARPAGRIPAARATRAVAALGLAAVLIGILAWPLVFTDGTFSSTSDWASHLRVMWLQSLEIRANFHPSLFSNDAHSVFYPEYAFYAGTLYAVIGSLSVLLGNAPMVAYTATYLACFAATYGGWYWMARMAGLGSWKSHVPGVIFITSPYYLTLIYARGDLPELTGVSMIPLVIASGLSVLRADRLRIWPALALVLSSVLFFGSHNLTVVWGSTVILLASAGAVVVVPEARRWLTPRSMLRVGALVLPALLINAWFLLPVIAYQSHTDISTRYPEWREVLRATMFMVSARRLFSLSRATVLSPGTDFALSLPILAMAWSLVSALIPSRNGRHGPWGRVLLICLGLMVLVGVVMTHAGLMLALPRPYSILQFAYRLETYVILAVSGAVLAVLAAAQKATRPVRLWTWMLAPILLVSVIGAIQQTAAYPRGGDRDRVLVAVAPGPMEGELNDYNDVALPILVDRHGPPSELEFPPASIRGERASKVVHLPPGELVYSNIGGGPELVRVTGAKIVGISPAGNDVLKVGPSVDSSKRSVDRSAASSPTEIVSVSPANGLPVVAGRLLSLGAAIFLLGGAALIAIRRIRAREVEHHMRAR